MRKQQSAQAEFTEKKLPHNRTDVFFDCINVRYPTFIRCGLILLAFALPLLGVYLLKDLYMFSLDYTLPQEELQMEMVSLSNLTAILALPAWIIFGFGFSGIIRIIRQLVWSNPVFFRKDFWHGVKTNGKIYACTFLSLGISLLFNTYIHNLPIYPEYLRLIPAVFSVVGLFPVFWFILSQTAVYRTRFFGCLKDSVFLYGKTVFSTFGISLCLLIPVLFNLIGNLIIKYLFLALYIVFLLPLAVMLWFLYSCNVFDKLINAKQFPELVGKGFWKPEDRHQ